jgi:RsmE family RNA methyltransferase
MNLILIFPEDFVAEATVLLKGARLAHIRDVLRSDVGDSVRVGQANGLLGTGRITALSEAAAELVVALTEPPPPPLAVTLLLALPRPKCFRRILQCATTMGVKRIALFGAYRVEKSYWQSPWLEQAELLRQLVLGLEQARDTVLPTVTFHPLFKPFVEDEVPELAAGCRRWVAHPGGASACPVGCPDPVTLAIGPEGGFTEYELGLLTERQFNCVTMGSRILRTEQAVPALLGRFIHT